MRNLWLVICSLFIVQFLPAQSSIEQKSTASLKKIFGDSISAAVKHIVLTPAERDSIARLSPLPWQTDSLNVYVCRASNTTVGYGFVDNVKGKTQFITYLAAIQPNGEVQDIDVLVYRESYGGEISYESFKKQFQHKTIADKLQPGRDIKNISGATISVRAITLGVKRILSTFDLIHHRLE